MTSSSSAASRSCERGAVCGAALAALLTLAAAAALAALLALAAAAALADGGEPPPDQGVAASTSRAIESRWRRPAGCAPAPAVAIREDGARILTARAEAPACRVQGDADAQVRAWLESLAVEVETLGPRPHPGR